MLESMKKDDMFAMLKFGTIETMLKADKDVIACPYPMKSLDWEKIFQQKDLRLVISQPKIIIKL